MSAGRRAGGRVLVSTQRKRPLALAVGSMFGSSAVSLEKRTLIKRGKPLASGYQKVRA